MMIFRKLLTTIIALPLVSLMAQTDADAFRFNWQYPSGSARFDATAGAIGALGGDASALTLNPATIGTLNKKTFGISFGLNSITNSTSYVGSSQSKNDASFVIPSISGVLVKKAENKYSKGWRTFQFGVSYNRLIEFNSTTQIKGSQNNNHAFLDEFAYLANGLTPEDLADPNYFEAFFSDLAYQTNLLQYDDTVVFAPGDTALHIYRNEFFDYPYIEQDRVVTERGGMDEISISLGANYDDKFYVGMSVGFLSGKYKSTMSFTETALDPATSVESYTFSEQLKQDIFGVDFKFGVLFRPVDWLRVGAALHAPYNIKITEDYSTAMTSTFRDNSSYEMESPLAQNKFRIKSPTKFVLSIGTTLKKSIALGLVYTVKNYRNMELNSADDFDIDYSYENENLITPYYKASHSLSAGVEVKLAKVFAIRGGYGIFSSPFSQASDLTQQVSGGFGYRNRFIFIDLSYKHYLSDPYTIALYPVNQGDLAQIKRTFGQFNLTVGIRLR